MPTNGLPPVINNTYEFNYTLFNGDPVNRSVTFSTQILVVILVAKNGIIQDTTTYDIQNNDLTIVYQADLNPGDVISAVIRTSVGGGGDSGDQNIDGGRADTIYTLEQNIDGGDSTT